MTEMDEIKLAAYNSYKRHMRVFGKGKDGMMFDSAKDSKLYVIPIGFVFTFGIAVIQVCISL